MGKKRKIIAYPQRFGRKFLRHPAAQVRTGQGAEAAPAEPLSPSPAPVTEQEK